MDGTIAGKSDLSKLFLSRKAIENRLADTTERLALSQRITSQNNDQAQLAEATKLTLDSRVFNQGVDNVQQTGLGLDVIGSALSSLQDLTAKLADLALTATKSVTTSTQRSDLNSEAAKLITEYRRVVQDAAFRDRKLIDGSTPGVNVQTGDTNYSLASIDARLDFTYVLSSYVGTGALDAATTFTTSTSATQTSIVNADVNSDGILDLIALDSTNSKADVSIGNGNGTFKAAVSFSSGKTQLVAADFDNDGNTDIAATNATTGKVLVSLGNGNGTFRAPSQYGGSGTAEGTIASGRFNSDGYTDLVSVVNDGASYLEIYAGNSNGSFSAPVTFQISGATNVTSVQVADINGDQKADLVYSDFGSNTFGYLLGNSDGSFNASVSYALDATHRPNDLILADLNGDNNLDAIIASAGGSNAVTVALGNSNGTFKVTTNYAAGSTPYNLVATDLNGDSKIDIVATSQGASTVKILLGNGDGTLKAPGSQATGFNAQYLTAGDYNSDGVSDIIATNPAGATANYLQGTRTLNSASSSLDLTAASKAYDAYGLAVSAYEQVSSDIGALTGASTRLYAAVNQLTAERDVSKNAALLIRGSNKADDTAKQTHDKILLDRNAALIAQANLDANRVQSLLSDATDTGDINLEPAFKTRSIKEQLGDKGKKIRGFS